MKKVKCLKKGFSNFTYGKIYEAVPHATKGLGTRRQSADYRIIDNDGDYYTVAETINELKNNWEWV